MDSVLRRLAEWKARSKAAQVIVFDGGAEVERTRAFLKGAAAGVALSFGLVLLTAPTDADEHLLDEARQRERLLRDADRQLQQAVQVADVCLNTAEQLERTVETYEKFLGSRAKR